MGALCSCLGRGPSGDGYYSDGEDIVIPPSPCFLLRESKDRKFIAIVTEREVHKDIEVPPMLYEDECPTCLQEYDRENPKIVARCSHHFHLGCIYEWMERSEYCPVCSKVMEFDEDIS